MNEKYRIACEAAGRLWEQYGPILERIVLLANAHSYGMRDLRDVLGEVERLKTFQSNTLDAIRIDLVTVYLRGYLDGMAVGAVKDFVETKQEPFRVDPIMARLIGYENGR